jgi:beta-galactosidase
MKTQPMSTRHIRRLPLVLFLALGAPILIANSAADESAPPPARERVSFNSGWRFMLGDPAHTAEALVYERIKPWVIFTGDNLLHYPPERAPRPRQNPAVLPGHDLMWARFDFDDSGWRKLDLPHDWAVEGPFRQELYGDSGKLPWNGSGWYRKHFDSPASDAGRRVFLDIDGAMSHAIVWLNGAVIGGWPYGYASWRLDLTPHLKIGERNVLVIRLDNSPESSRWYAGGGIYRNVWLVKTAPAHVAQWGVRITTPVVTTGSAIVDVAVTLDNDSATHADMRVATRLFIADDKGKPTGKPVATGKPNTVRMPPGRHASTAHTFAIAEPRLWGLRERNRYVAETTVADAKGDIIDRVETPFGIRKISVDAARGFFLNDEPVHIRGVCLHHDLGALGAALNLRALERQLEIMRDMGCNAIRTSHNPPAPELLELCDRMGFLVLDETFDAWSLGKKRDDYSRIFHDWHEKDLRAHIRRDRNHPCVVMWSFGNEILEQFEPDGWKLAAHLAAIIREEDRTRPLTAGFSHIQSGYNGFQNVVDIVGYTYKPHEFANFRAAHPHIPVFDSESASTVSSRGEYFFPVRDDKLEGRADYQISSYDLYSPRWGTTPDTEWRAQAENPGVIGEFVWTGFDYLGEPTPYNADVTNVLNYSNAADRARAEKELAELGKITVPSRSSYFGIVDLAGFPKDRYYLYQSHWRPDLPMAHILPHWNWPERAGQVTPVHVYTSGDEAELFLNGKSLGRKKRAPLEYRFRWDEVVYEPGELKVVTWKDGKPWAESTTRTTGPAARLTLAADRARLRADGRDLAFVTVAIADSDGQPVPRTKNLIRFRVTGPAEIAATDNGNAIDHTPFHATERRAYNSLVLVILRAKPGESGEITLHAESEGLQHASIMLRSEPWDGPSGLKRH